MVVLRALLPAVHFPGLRDPLELVRPALGHVLQANRAGTHPQPSPIPAVIGRYHKRRPARGLVKKGLVSIPLRLSFFKKVVVCGHSLVVTLSLTINDTLKWLSSESFWW